MRITVWNENIHETRGDEIVRGNYPEGIHGAIAAGLREHFDGPDDEVRTATLQEPEHGLTAEVLDDTDVLLWWGHIAHDRVSDDAIRMRFFAVPVCLPRVGAGAFALVAMEECSPSSRRR